MKLFRTNAEELLVETVRSLSGKRNSWRCIVLNAEEQGEKDASYNSRARVETVIGIINETLKDDDGHIYLCQDGEIFILFQGMMRPVMDRLSHYFAGLRGVKGATPRLIFNLGTDWDFFLPLCEAKMSHSAAPIALAETDAVGP